MGHTALPHLPLQSAAFTRWNFFIAAADVSYCFPTTFLLLPSLDLSSLGAIFYPLLFSMLRRLSVSIGPSEESAEGG